MTNLVNVSGASVPLSMILSTTDVRIYPLTKTLAVAVIQNWIIPLINVLLAQQEKYWAVLSLLLL
jgi:hypothetical protein